MKLIVNSDDYGLTPGVNLGIIDALKRGILRSTTAMMNMPAIEMAADLAKENPELGVGIHLVLSAGKPLLNTHKTIVDENGNFLKNAVFNEKDGCRCRGSLCGICSSNGKVY
jgi:chitin disaccharide deacetylase